MGYDAHYMFSIQQISILNYLQYCWEFIANNENSRAITVLHLCSAHIMHRISYNFNKKFKLEKVLKRIILHAFSHMVNCRHMNEINQLFGLVCYILCSKKQTSVYYNKLRFQCTLEFLLFFPYAPRGVTRGGPGGAKAPPY